MKSVVKLFSLLIFFPIFVFSMQESRKTLKVKLREFFAESYLIAVQETMQDSMILNLPIDVSSRITLLKNVSMLIDNEKPAPAETEKKWSEDIYFQLISRFFPHVEEISPADFKLIEQSDDKRLYVYLSANLNHYNQNLKAPNNRISRYILALSHRQKNLMQQKSTLCQSVLDEKKKNASLAKSKAIMPPLPPIPSTENIIRAPALAPQVTIEAPSAACSLPSPSVQQSVMVNSAKCLNTPTREIEQKEICPWAMTDTLVLASDFKEMVSKQTANIQKINIVQEEHQRLSREKDSTEKALQILAPATQATISGVPAEVLTEALYDLQHYNDILDRKIPETLVKIKALKEETPSTQVEELRSEIVARKEERNQALDCVERQERDVETKIAQAQEILQSYQSVLFALKNTKSQILKSHDRINTALREVNRYDLQLTLKTGSGIPFVQHP